MSTECQHNDPATEKIEKLMGSHTMIKVVGKTPFKPCLKL